MCRVATMERAGTLKSAGNIDVEKSENTRAADAAKLADMSQWMETTATGDAVARTGTR